MYAKALNLPESFQFDLENVDEHGRNLGGGGAIQTSASDALLLALLTARSRAVQNLNAKHKLKLHSSHFLSAMVAYTSDEAHSCVEKAAKIAMIRLRILETDEHGVLHGSTVANAISEDVADNFIPVFVSATVGTTGTCAFDNIEEIGKVCKKYETIWYHVDGAYGGNSFMLPEMESYKNGLEYADSFDVNPTKFALTTFDSTCFWVKKVQELKDAMNIMPEYLKPDPAEGEDFRHYGVALSRKFRSLKLWFVLRNYGIKGLQAFMRNHIKLAKHFKYLIQSDDNLTVENQVTLGLVCFRLVVPNKTEHEVEIINREFLQRINRSGRLHMVPTYFKKKYIIRFTLTCEHITKELIGKCSKMSQILIFIFKHTFHSTVYFTEESFHEIQHFAAETIAEADKILEENRTYKKLTLPAMKENNIE